MSGLLWNDVKHLFDPDLMGALPDLSVPGTSVADWQAVFDLVRSSGWEWEYRVGGGPAPLPPAAEILARPPDDDGDGGDGGDDGDGRDGGDDGEGAGHLRVRPAPDVTVIFWPVSADTVDFDVDLRELRGQRGVDVLCGVLCAIGRRLDKPVTMSPEGADRDPVLGYDPATDRVRPLADPGPFARAVPAG
ncbi:hypothetical protein ACSNOK_09585 [Streptomyces sp. URMC 126]|uniref:hypothetical protein n=1 Tax=Streptomyces sp. URMC 126 TaxID=3423401 RepID=UPI003F1AB225